VLACGIVLSSATPALAQMQWTDKGFIAVSGGVQVGSSDVANDGKFEIYGEDATFASAQDVKGGPFFDVQAGYRVWRNLAIGASFTTLSSKSDAAISASIPDPIKFDSLRDAAADVTDLQHKETWVAGLLTWGMPITDKLDVLFSGGPAFVTVSQEIPTGVTVGEPGPTLSNVTVTEFSESGIGFVVGGDVRYMVTSRFGIGLLAKFAAASVDIADGVKLDAGGFQIGGGIRVRF
jgi:hypothetical protein